jgi:hypothetical protein
LPCKGKRSDQGRQAMITITRILAKVAKINGSAKTRDHVESLIMAAYEAGRRDGVADVRITLEDDHGTDHTPALEIITANY